MHLARSSRAVVVLVAVIATSGAIIAPAAVAATIPARRRPNVLFVLTDDLDRSELRFMPHTRALIGDGGATFDNYFVSNSLCCPSRVTTLRGQYAHNAGVWSNGGSNGGFERAFREGIEHDTVATRLSGSGYRTALVGKYLNGYPNTVSPTYRPPGWTTFVSPSFGTPYGEYGYTLNDNGRLEYHGRRHRDYGTGVYVRRTQHFVRTAVHANMPFFAYLAVYAPHQPATHARRDRRPLPSADPVAPSRGSWCGEVGAHVAQQRATRQHVHRVHIGQRLPPRPAPSAGGEQTAYDTDIHVPLLIRGPGITAGTHVTQLTGNVDLAPTFEAMTGVSAPSFTDGRSLLGLAAGSARAGRHWRSAYLVEHRNEDPDQGGAHPARPWPRAHGHLRQPRDEGVLARHEPIPDYDAVRTLRYLYVAYANGDRELYDTSTDPGEIHNLVGTMPTVEHALAQGVDNLRGCRARGCRVAEARRVPSGAQ